MERRRVVITGIGVVTPIGNTLAEFWDGVQQGRSGAAPIVRFDTAHFDTKFACEVKKFDPLLYLNRKEIQRMDLFAQLAIAASAQAVEDSKLDMESVDHDRVGVVFGSGIGGMWTYHNQQQLLYERGGNPDRISPFFIPMLIADIAAGYISMRWNFRGPNYATTSACATSSHAIADAYMLLQRGAADVMVTGGSESVICPMGVGGFNSMKALSTRNDDPARASRPFERDRDGFVMGEGGGCLVLETLEHAQSRGARIYAEVAGVGMTADAHHITLPSPGGEGAVRSMRAALDDALMLPTDVQYINAHGTSTGPNDRNETAAIKTVVGDHAYKLAVSSTKSQVGHLLGAAGVVGAIAAVMAIHTGIVPPTINYENPDPDCDLDYVPNRPRAMRVDAAISNAFGFGGHNATLAFRAL
jgi:3-oxoacyl-[acyl-carrier-protein] synthase II